MKARFEYTVSSRDAGIQLLSFLKERLKDQWGSIKALKRTIDAGGCRVNGRVELFSTHPLKCGDFVCIDFIREEKKRDIPAILYEDEELLICDKPAGFLSDPHAFNREFPRFQGQLRLAHRLDKGTSGVILLTKHEKALKAMEALFFKRKIHKFYIALVHGLVAAPKDKVENFLIPKQRYQGQTVWGGSKSPRGGSHALTLWRCLVQEEGTSLLLAEPITGRTHQLRSHFAQIGHPVLGDLQYGKGICSAFPRLFLHAVRIRFMHPFTQREIQVQAPLPKEFIHKLKCVDALDPYC